MKKKKVGRPKSSPIDPIIGERIREARLLMNPKMTQEKLAIEMNVSRDTIRNWEKGRARPEQEETYLKLASILNVSPEWIKNNEVSDILRKTKEILDSFDIKTWKHYSPPSIKEEARSYTLINALIMCGYKLEDIYDKKQYSEYMESSIKNSIEFYIKNLNKKG